MIDGTLKTSGSSAMTLFEANQTTRELAARISAFMDEHVYPAEPQFLKEAEEAGPWAVYPTVERLKAIAKRQGLWNLWLPKSEHADGLTNLEYAPLCEIMGRSPLAAGSVQLQRA